MHLFCSAANKARPGKTRSPISKGHKKGKNTGAETTRRHIRNMEKTIETGASLVFTTNKEKGLNKDEPERQGSETNGVR